MTQLQSGDVAKLVVKEVLESKYILNNPQPETAELIEILLNKSEVLEELVVGDFVEVFLFADRRGGLSATTMIPHVLKDQYGWAKVLQVKDYEGAKVDIGTSREVTIQAMDLPVLRELWPEPGDHVYMTLRTDREGALFGRLITEDRLTDLYAEAAPELFNKNIKARPYRLLPVGTFLIGVDEPYRIFVHETERTAEPRLGEEVTVRVIEVKEDGTVNASMLPRVYERLSADADKIFEYLQQAGGKMPFGDKSSPDEIYEMFGMSKGAFKRALGTLMKAERIIQADGWTTIKE
ncbi:MAG: DNA-binding protein [Kurthia sp.]|nr:DNA-binding protein [Candidatus Kurthia equi]